MNGSPRNFELISLLFLGCLTKEISYAQISASRRANSGRGRKKVLQNLKMNSIDAEHRHRFRNKDSITLP
jgi:hypothetical protein